MSLNLKGKLPCTPFALHLGSPQRHSHRLWTQLLNIHSHWPLLKCLGPKPAIATCFGRLRVVGPPRDSSAYLGLPISDISSTPPTHSSLLACITSPHPFFIPFPPSRLRISSFLTSSSILSSSSDAPRSPAPSQSWVDNIPYCRSRPGPWPSECVRSTKIYYSALSPLNLFFFVCRFVPARLFRCTDSRQLRFLYGPIRSRFTSFWRSSTCVCISPLPCCWATTDMRRWRWWLSARTASVVIHGHVQYPGF